MKWDVDFQCFVIRGGGVSRGKQASRLRRGVEWMQWQSVGISVVYYLLTVAFAWATSYGAFKQQVPALNIWPACRVQGMGMGDGNAEHLRPGASIARHII